MGKAGLIAIILVFSIIFIPSGAYAGSAAGVSPSTINIPFFPLYEGYVTFRPIGYEAIDFEMKCPYVHVRNETLYDEDGVNSFTVDIKLPQKIDAIPGKYDCGFIMHKAKDINAPPGVAAKAEVKASINILIPVEGKYATITLSADNVNKGEPVYFKVSASNLGDTPLYALNAVIDVMDIDGNIKETLYTTQSDVQPFSSTEMWKKMDTEDFEPARYNAKAVMAYGGEKPAYAETSFLIGKLFVKFLGIQMNATEGKINPVTVDVESWWGDPIENVRAEISIYNASGVLKGEFRTESTDLSPWQKATLRGYWDANGIEAGNYDANVTLRYKGGETSEIVKVKLNSLPEEKKKSDAFGKIAGVIASPVFLILLVLILVINISVWLIKQKKQKKEEK
ncbi:MAG: hypothetical protein PHO02_05075 [Candidatus Nanoarchaeia archaeon]|nr:hypothetical protein [Candidatus Nanoarchaeia archaeon]